MSEVLFRGKSVGTGKFVQGFLMLNNKINVNDPLYDENGKYICDRYTPVLVYENTIGQYTGLKDKNGEKVFEGDLLKLEEVKGLVKYFDGAFHLILEGDNSGRNVLLQERTKRFEIIGNIHEEGK